MRIISVALVLFFALGQLCFLHAADTNLSIDLGEGQVVELVLIKHGSFVQGSPESETGREADEQQHRVSLSKDFYISKTPITVGQFRRFVADAHYKTEAESGTSGGYGLAEGKIEQRHEFNWSNPGYAVTDNHPVSIVTVKDAIAFNEWMTKKAKRTIQLPSESQWEFACRAGTQTRFYSGNKEGDFESIGWSKKNASTPMPVGQKQSNAFGLYDMSGNVFQWCGDLFAPYSQADVSDPQIRQVEDGERPRVVLRGGSFNRLPKNCRSAARYRADKGTRNVENGFRVVSLDNTPASEVAALLENWEDAATKQQQSTSQQNLPQSNTNQQANSNQQRPDDSVQQATQTTPPASDHTTEPTSTEFRTSRGFSFPAILCLGFFIVLAGIVGVIVLVVFSRPTARPVETTRAVGGFAVPQTTGPIRITNDGFWLQTAGYVAGSTVFYTYFASGINRGGSIVVNSGGQQFVYTGDTPASVVIDRVDEPVNNLEPYDNTQQDNWNQFSRSSQHTQSQPKSADTSSTSNQPVEQERSSDRDLLSEGSSRSFPPAY